MDENINFNQTNVELKPKRVLLKVVFGILIVFAFSVLAAGTFIGNLNKAVVFAEPISVVIDDGDSVPIITEKLEQAGVVQSNELLYLVLVMLYDTTQIKASQYIFTEPLTTLKVADKLIKGDFATDLIDITVFEGESREKIVERLTGEYPWFDGVVFLKLTKDREGELFPDTYYVPKDFSTEKFVNLLRNTHDAVVAEYETELNANEFTLEEVLTLASIVEREANTTESMRYVAGVFKNRMDIGMALQADATIEYVLEHDLNELRPGELAQNLREVDSPYNTYLYAGLPPSPIGNPGREAIEAVLNPITSDYFYYITGNDGEFYYAETYAQHIRNINLYLK